MKQTRTSSTTKRIDTLPYVVLLTEAEFQEARRAVQLLAPWVRVWSSAARLLPGIVTKLEAAAKERAKALGSAAFVAVRRLIADLAARQAGCCSCSA